MFAISIAGCSQPLKTRIEDPDPRKREEASAQGPMGPAVEPAPMGPTAPENASLPAREPGIELHLGEGMAAGFAYQGVLKALHEWKVKLVKIRAEEIGALIASAYAVSGNLNRMDWVLTRFPENSFTNKTSGLLIRGLEPVETRLEKRLLEAFEKSSESDFVVPVEFRGVNAEGLSLWEKIRVSVSHPPIIGDYKDHKKESVPENPTETAHTAKNKILVIAVKPSGQTRVVRTVPGELLEVELGIPSFSDDDFKRKSQAAFYGKSQLEKLKKEIMAFLQPEDLR